MDDTDSLQYLLSETSQEQLIPEGVNSLTQDQEITGMSGFIPWNNSELFQQNTNSNGDRSFSSYAPSVGENTEDAGVGIDTAISNEQIMNNQMSLSPHLRDYILNPEMTWDSQGMEPYLQPTFDPLPMMPEPLINSRLSMHSNYHTPLRQLEVACNSFGYDNHNNQFHSRSLMPNGHMEQDFGNLLHQWRGSMQAVDERNNVHNQLLNVPNLQGHNSAFGSQLMGSRIAGLSDNTSMFQMPQRRSILSMEPYLQPTLVPLPMMSGPHINSGYDNRNNQFYSRGLMSNGHMEQDIGSLMHQWRGSLQVAGERNNLHNQFLNVPNLQGYNSTFGSELMGSRIAGLSDNTSIFHMPERLLRYDHRNNQNNSQFVMPNGRMEQGIGNFIQLPGGSTRMGSRRYDLQRQLLEALTFLGHDTTIYQPTTLPPSITGLHAIGSRHMGNADSQVRTSETTGLFRQGSASNIQLQQVAPAPSSRPTVWKNWKGKNGEEYVPPRRGRPRKRLEDGESSKCPKRQKKEKDSLGTENAATIPIQQEGNIASRNVTDEAPNNVNPTSPSASSSVPAPRDVTNGLNDPTVDKKGVPTDHHL